MTCKAKYDLFIFLMLYLALIVVQAFGQETTMYLGNKQLAKENNKWYILENDRKFEVNESSMTVKFKENVDKSNMDVFSKEFSLKIERENQLGYIDLEIPEGTSFKEVYDYYIKTGLFESVEVNSYGFIFDDPDDVYYDLQHYLFNDDGYSLIWANAAWEYEDGSNNQSVIAVVDLGVDFDNDDILDASNIGYDYVGIGDTDPSPATSDNHGTGIAGIAAAIRNNNAGIAGIAGGNYDNSDEGAKIMALRVGYMINDEAYIISSKIDDAIVYAANNGAKIINMSFGVSESSAINAAIEYAYGTKKCFLVGSNHNESEDTALPYPARHDLVFACGGLDQDGTEYSFVKSTDKDKLDICAPAEAIYSTKNITGSDTYACQYYYGCSFAAPQVCGAAALIYSHSSSFIPLDIKNMIRSTADDSYSNYDSDYHGQGALDIGLCLEYLDDGTLDADIPQNLSVSTVAGKPKLTWSSVTSADKYIIYRAGYQKRYDFKKIGETTNTNYTDNSVASKIGVTYYYRVSTYENGWGASITSTEVSYTTSGSSSKMAAQEDADLISYEYNLGNNYPNPFNPSTIISFSLRESGLVKLSIYNLLGDEKAVLVNEYVEKGHYDFKFNASNLSSGIYFCRIKVNDFSATRKMIITK
jgi:hypothetical protein